MERTTEQALVAILEEARGVEAQAREDWRDAGSPLSSFKPTPGQSYTAEQVRAYAAREILDLCILYRERLEQLGGRNGQS